MHTIHEYTICDELARRVTIGSRTIAMREPSFLQIKKGAVLSASDDLSVFVVTSAANPPRFFQLDIGSATCKLIYECTSGPSPLPRSLEEEDAMPVFPDIGDAAAAEEEEELDEDEAEFMSLLETKPYEDQMMREQLYFFSPHNNDAYALVRQRRGSTKYVSTHLVKFYSFSWLRRRHFAMFLSGSGFLHANNDAPESPTVSVFSNKDACRVIASCL